MPRPVSRRPGSRTHLAREAEVSLRVLRGRRWRRLGSSHRWAVTGSRRSASIIQELDTGRHGMKAIVVTDEAAGTVGMTLVERPEPPAAINDVIVQVHASGFVP